MTQILLHLLGDFFLQNDWMATNKATYSREGWIACIIHCLLYAIPFGICYGNAYIFLLVLITHFLVDKFTLARFVTKFINWRWERDWGGTNYSHDLGFDHERPPYITVWIHIIRDNTIHIAGNYFIIMSLS